MMIAARAWGAALGAALLFLCGGCGVRTANIAPDAALTPYAGRTVDQVRFAGAGPFSADTLLQLIETVPKRCTFLGLSICIPFLQREQRATRLDLATLERDVNRLVLFYRQSGFFGTRVIPVVNPEANPKNVVVSFVIWPGTPVYLASLAIEGVAGRIPPGIEQRIPSKVGSLFDLGDFTASADTVQRELLDAGYAYAQVLRNYTADTVTHQATASLVAVPGPRVVVDSIEVTGAPHLGRTAVLRQLTIHKGDILRSSKLAESQRNLYDLEIVEFASVAVAPESLQVHPRDSSRATVLVQITEAPVHVVEAAAGYGSVDCFRARTRWTSRSFGGGARRLILSGAVSKIGIAKPFNFGLQHSICRAFVADTFDQVLNYAFSADLTQPWFLSPRNRLTVTAYAERISEPRVFQTVAQGGRFAVAHRVGRRDLLTLALDISHGKTIATQALFCAAFLVCLPADIDSLSKPRWLNALGANFVRDRTNISLDPTSGYRFRTGVAWAAPELGSQVHFVRGVGEGSVYAPLGASDVLVFHLWVGSFFGTASLAPGSSFLPPDQRFYAGGATTVRGYSWNELGPGVYVGATPVFNPNDVTFFPTGGTGVVVGNVELRFPSPIATNLLRLALFADAGEITASGLSAPQANKLRVTPGFGIRARTPVGPVRLDIGFNPYNPIAAPLFLPDTVTGGLIRVLDNFTPPPPTFLGRFRINLAVGEPF